MSGEDKITLEEMRFISIFQEFTGVTVYRCIVDDEFNRLIFLVGKGEAGRAIGKNGRNVKALREVFNRDVEVVEYSSDLSEMIRNLFPGVRIEKIHVSSRSGSKMVKIKVADEDKGTAIGKNGRNVKRARLILSKLFGIERVKVS